MLKNTIFNIRPKGGQNIVITKKKLVMGLVIFLALFSVLKIYNNASLKRELFKSNIYIVLATIKDPTKTDEFNKAFTGGQFCGWKVEGADGMKTSSADYEKTAAGKHLMTQEFVYNGIKQTLSICLSNLSFIDLSIKRQMLFVFIVSVLIIFILYYTRFADDQPDYSNET